MVPPVGFKPTTSPFVAAISVRAELRGHKFQRTKVPTRPVYLASCSLRTHATCVHGHPRYLWLFLYSRAGETRTHIFNVPLRLSTL